MAIYVVGERLVRATSQANAVVRVVRELRKTLKAKLASQDDLLKMAVAGVKVLEPDLQDEGPLENGGE